MTLPRNRAWVMSALVICAFASVCARSALAVSDSELQQADLALKAAPADDAKRIQLASLHYLKGSDFSKSGKSEAALDEFLAAQHVLEAGNVAEQTPVYEEARYALGFTYVSMDRAQDAVVVLDQLVAASPRFSRARYLLGLALLKTGAEASFRRGIEVLIQLAKDTPGPDGTAATHAAGRFAYNLAVGLSGIGEMPQAFSTLRSLKERLGLSMGADDAENQALFFGWGSIQLQQGNFPGALSVFEAVRGMNPRFKLKNGVTIQQVLANTYYQAGLEQLSRGSPGALQDAIVMFDNAERASGSQTADTHHGKALAYKQLNQPDRMAEEMAIILKIDPSYYKRVNVGG